MSNIKWDFGWERHCYKTYKFILLILLHLLSCQSKVLMIELNAEGISQMSLLISFRSNYMLESLEVFKGMDSWISLENSTSPVKGSHFPFESVP